MGFLDDAIKKLHIAGDELKSNISNKSKKFGKNDITSSERTACTTAASVSSFASSFSNLTMSEVVHYKSHATRWEKAVVATDCVVKEVTKFDPDGIEIVCVGGCSESLDIDIDGDTSGDGIEWHENIRDTLGVEEKITTKHPGGPCPLGRAVDQVLTKALASREIPQVLRKYLEHGPNDKISQKIKDKIPQAYRKFQTPCSVLVLTAGKPDDAELLEETLARASQSVADRGGIDSCPLSITFIQIGSDPKAAKYLEYLDKKMVGICNKTSKKVDIVDTMGYLQLKAAVENMRKYSEKGSSLVEIFKKFFRSVGTEDDCDYVLVLDRSVEMQRSDYMGQAGPTDGMVSRS